MIDLEHRLTWANEALVKLWGRGDVRGKRWLELAYEPWHPELHDREIDQVIATRRPIRGEVPFTGTGGRRVYDYIFAPEFGDQPPAHRGRAPRAEARPARRAGLEGDPVQGLLNSLAK